jgi:hypothetical protein
MRVLSLLRVGYYIALAASSACGIADAAATPPFCKGTRAANLGLTYVLFCRWPGEIVSFESLTTIAYRG